MPPSSKSLPSKPPSSKTKKAASQSQNATYTLPEVLADGWKQVADRGFLDFAGGEGNLFGACATPHSLFELTVTHADTQLAKYLDGVLKTPSTETMREQLFDVLMYSFDIFQPYKQGLKVAAQELKQAPHRSVSYLQSGACLLRSSLERVLQRLEEARLGGDEGANGTKSGCLKPEILTQKVFQPLRVKALMVIYLQVLQVWLQEDTLDTSKTMARLDKSLGLAEEIANFAAGLPFYR